MQHQGGGMKMSLKSVDLNHFPRRPLQAAEFNKCVEREQK